MRERPPTRFHCCRAPHLPVKGPLLTTPTKWIRSACLGQLLPNAAQIRHDNVGWSRPSSIRWVADDVAPQKRFRSVALVSHAAAPKRAAASATPFRSSSVAIPQMSKGRRMLFDRHRWGLRTISSLLGGSVLRETPAWPSPVARPLHQHTFLPTLGVRMCRTTPHLRARNEGARNPCPAYH